MSRVSPQPRIGIQELFAPVVVIQQARRVAFQKFQRRIKGFDGGESFAGIGVDFRLARIRCLQQRQRTNFDMLIERFHSRSQTPCSIKQQKAAICVSLGKNWTTNAQSYVSSNVNRHRVWKCAKDKPISIAERFHGALAAPFR